MKNNFLIVLFGLFVYIMGCKSNGKSEAVVENSDFIEYFCGAENVSEDGSMFKEGQQQFNGIASRTKTEAFEGKYSISLNKENPYGMTLIMDDLAPGSYIEAEVFKKGKEKIGGIAIQNGNDFYVAENIGKPSKEKSDWEKLTVQAQLPFELSGKTKVYVFNSDPDGEMVYFDALKIKVSENKEIEDEVFKDSRINIVIADVNYDQLKQFRHTAIKQGIISSDLKKEVDAVLTYGNSSYPITIKLKGDWTDHLVSKMWSYRINIQGGQAFLGLKSFSLQSPKVRDNLNEWLLHEVALKEGLLATRMEYVPVAINGKFIGVYNLEEHFLKQLVESKKRREGPILKFSEDAFWECNLFYNKTKIEPKKPFYEPAVIEPFNAKKTLKKENLRDQFLIAQNLMNNYKNGSKSLDKIIDIERFAKMYALLDLGNASHSLHWHNQRYYYNPIISKLEYILYDVYPGEGSYNKRKFTLLGESEKEVETVRFLKEHIVKMVFNNEEFRNNYIKYLKKFSSEKYIEEVYENYGPKIDSLEILLGYDNQDYNYDRKFLKENAKAIRSALPKYESKIKAGKLKFEIDELKYENCDVKDPFTHISLNAYIEKKEKGRVELSLKNYHCEPIKVIGFSTKKSKGEMIAITSKITLDAYKNNDETKALVLKEKPKNLYFKVDQSGRDSIYKVGVVNWPRPMGKLPYEDVLDKPLNPKSTAYTLTDKKITFNSGKHVLRDNVIIPSGMEVIFSPGAEITLNNGKFILSYSPVTMQGTKENPIKVISTDGTGMGLTVLQAEKESKLNHVVFDGLNTFSVEGWVLTGAVTFFESDVIIKNCLFTNNKCEDALNVVSSNFLFDNNEVSYTYSDGFDADFCTGIVKNSYFHHTGNDCIDFSTSQLDILDCDIMYSGDKGISCGENSQINIKNVNVDGAVIGVASKDLSTVVVENLYLYKCETGFGVYEKKPEFGPASITVSNYILTDVKAVDYADKGSKVVLKNKIEAPKEAKNKEDQIKIIRSDAKWMSKLEEKAKTSSKSINQVVSDDANWIMKKENKN